MSSWTYCTKCDVGLDEPTIRQVLDELYCCPHCNAPQDPRKYMKDTILELLDRVEALEARHDSDT